MASQWRARTSPRLPDSTPCCVCLVWSHNAIHALGPAHCRVTQCMEKEGREMMVTIWGGGEWVWVWETETEAWRETVPEKDSFTNSESTTPIRTWPKCFSQDIINCTKGKAETSGPTCLYSCTDWSSEVANVRATGLQAPSAFAVVQAAERSGPQEAGVSRARSLPMILLPVPQTPQSAMVWAP